MPSRDGPRRARLGGSPRVHGNARGLAMPSRDGLRRARLVGSPRVHAPSHPNLAPQADVRWRRPARG